jgi:hypothetical protein
LCLSVGHKVHVILMRNSTLEKVIWNYDMRKYAVLV